MCRFCINVRCREECQEPEFDGLEAAYEHSPDWETVRTGNPSHRHDWRYEDVDTADGTATLTRGCECGMTQELFLPAEGSELSRELFTRVA